MSRARIPLLKRWLDPLESRVLLALTPIGGETLINTTFTSDQFAPAVARNATGASVVAWVSANQDGSGNGIYAQRLASNGSAVGAEFRVNSITTGLQSTPDVAIDSSGNFVVTWISENIPGGNGLDVVARRFNSSGAALDATEFLVNAFTTGAQESPAVAMTGAGNFVITWDSAGEDGSSYGVYARTYSAAGAATSGEIAVNQTTADLQADPAIAIDSAGDYVIAWTSGSTIASSQYDIYARRFNGSSPLANEFRVNNSVTADYQTFPSVAIDSAGDFVVAFNSYTPGASGYDIYARRYNNAGTAQGTEFRVNTFTTGDQNSPAVGIDPAGRFTIAWSSLFQDGSDRGVFAQSFTAAGAFDGIERSVNTTTDGTQTHPALAVDGSGGALIAWQDGPDSGIDGEGFAVVAQRFVLATTPPPYVSASAFNYLTSQTLTFTFSQDVHQSLSLSDITVRNLTTNTTFVAGQYALSYNRSTNVATITFSSSLADGNYTATLAAAGINDGTYALDGNHDGTPGDDFSLPFFFLNGDINHNRVVDINDLGILASNWQQSGRTFAQGDLDYSGTVDISDLGILASHWQQSLPAPIVAAASVFRTSRVADDVLR